MSTPAKMRDSNMELLRIICMLLILVHHFIIHVFYPDLSLHDGNINPYRIACIIINGFAYVGVNCFILISGYYGIKFKVRSLFNLYCICVFYGVLTSLMKCAGGVDMELNKSLVYQILLPFSHSTWWFIKCYVALFLVAPFLNKATENLKQREFACAIIWLTLLNVYLGYYWHQHNNDGYNLLQFIFIYLIGSYLKKHPLKQLDKKRSMLLYTTCGLFWSILTIISIKWKVPHWISFQYNNPLVLLAAIGLFGFMTNVKFYSHLVNVIASSVLAAYLIQDMPGGLVYTLADTYNNTMILPLSNNALKILLMMAFVLLGSITVLGVSFVFDRARMVLMKPIWWVYDHIIKEPLP